MTVKMPPHDILPHGAKWYLKELDIEPCVMPDLERMGHAATYYTPDGKMGLWVTPKWESYSPELQAEILAHEAGHVAGGHDTRKLDRHPLLWNLVCDAAIHYSGGVQGWAIKELSGVTYDQLGIPPVTPEIGYDMLMDAAQEAPHGGCGRDGVGDKACADTAAAKTRALVAGIRGAAAMGQNGDLSKGQPRVIPDIVPSFPAWVHEVLARLKKVAAYDDPVRRWIKETRRDVEPIMMPGRGPRQGVACTFILDASGSIDNDTLIRFFGAVESTPELASSELVVFSDSAVGPLPVRQARTLIDECPSGGTSFMAAARLRRAGVPVVWLTDGYTGDGWPVAHDTDELWVISTEVVAPHGVTIHATA